MTFRSRLLCATLALALLAPLSSCSSKIVGVPPSEDKPIVVYPGGTRAYYRDEDITNIITLREDGTYRFDSSGQFDDTVTSREGVWKWRSSGTHKAELVLDSDVWILNFVGYESAIAVNTAAQGRTFAFQFERM